MSGSRQTVGAFGADCQALIEQETEAVALRAGDVLFHEGEQGDAVYFVVAGALGVSVAGEGDQRRLISVIGAGETVGEMALLSGEPRSATVAAIRDSELLRLDKSRFDSLLESRPEIVSGFVRLLVERLRRAGTGHEPAIEPRVVALLAAGDDVAIADVADRLAAHLGALGLSVCTVDNSAVGRESTWFDSREAAHDTLLLIGSSADAGWAARCIRQADKVVVVARSTATASEGFDAALYRRRGPHQIIDLVLLHDDAGRVPSGTMSWLDAVPARRHFHVREPDDSDWDRLARVISGRALGLVLSGGGARAYAHIGVYRAFCELGLPIDYVGGTSMGAIIAAGIAAGWSPREMGERVHSAFVAQNPLSDYTLPLLGLVKGAKVARLLREHFGDIAIPDLWRPFYCVSSNLTAGGVHIHRSGALVDALRASIALPGVLPPVVRDDCVLVDGGVTCNLPVNIMRSSHRGPGVAVDVARDLTVDPEVLTTDMSAAWRQRLARLPIISILIRSGTMASEASDRLQAENADIVIAPSLGDIEIRDWQAFDKAVESGYAHTMRLFETAEALPDALQRCLGLVGRRAAGTGAADDR